MEGSILEESDSGSDSSNLRVGRILISKVLGAPGAVLSLVDNIVS